MDPVQLGRSGLRVSPLCLGTMTFGQETAERRRPSDRRPGLRRGGVLLGHRRHVRKGTVRGDRRPADGRAAATRSSSPPRPGRRWARGPTTAGLSARHLIAACEASLERLQTDWIDLYYLHLPDRSVPLDEIPAGDGRPRAQRQGPVRRVLELPGLGGDGAPGDGRAPRMAAGDRGPAALQPGEPRHRGRAAAHVPGQGARRGQLLAPRARGPHREVRRWQSGQQGETRLARSNPRFLQAEWRQESVDRVGGAGRALAEERGHTAAELAVAWAMANKAVHSVIGGPRTMAAPRGLPRGGCCSVGRRSSRPPATR